MPLEANELFDDVKEEEAKRMQPMRDRVNALTAVEAAALLGCSEHEIEFHERLLLIQRMNANDSFANEVVSYYKPPY